MVAIAPDGARRPRLSGFAIWVPVSLRLLVLTNHTKQSARSELRILLDRLRSTILVRSRQPCTDCIEDTCASRSQPRPRLQHAGTTNWCPRSVVGGRSRV